MKAIRLAFSLVTLAGVLFLGIASTATTPLAEEAGPSCNCSGPHGDGIWYGGPTGYCNAQSCTWVVLQ
jgi:hypothetical protein